METLSGRFPVPVYYEDTDALGLVYHANFLKFFERARSELVGSQVLKAIHDEGIAFVVRKVEVDFHRPAYLFDRLEVRSELQYSQSPRLKALQSIFRQETLIAKAIIELVAIDQAGKPVRLSTAILDLLRSTAARNSYQP